MTSLDRIGGLRSGRAVVFAVILMAHASYIPNGFSWLDRGDIVEARAILPLGRLMEAISAPFGNTAISLKDFGPRFPGFSFLWSRGPRTISHSHEAPCESLRRRIRHDFKNDPEVDRKP